MFVCPGLSGRRVRGIGVYGDMDRVDRLLNKAKPKLTINEKLAKDNPFLGETDSTLLDYMCPTSEKYRPMKKGTWEFFQFMYALMHAPHEPSELELEEEDV